MSNLSNIAWLKSELAQRQEKNALYSLRGFARDLGLSPTLMSHIFSGKRKITGTTLLKIAEKLELTPHEVQQFMSEHRTDHVPIKPDKQFVPLDADRFDLIADWHHFAILSLADVKGSRCDPKWIAKRLGISEPVADSALARLLRLKIIAKHGKGFKQIAPPIDSTHDIPSSAVRRQHRQLLQKAEFSLTNDPIDERHFGAVTLAIQKADLPKAKKMLRDFRGKFTANMESIEGDRVYVMTAHFFPIDKP